MSVAEELFQMEATPARGEAPRQRQRQYVHAVSREQNTARPLHRARYSHTPAHQERMFVTAPRATKTPEDPAPRRCHLFSANKSVFRSPAPPLGAAGRKRHVRQRAAAAARCVTHLPSRHAIHARRCRYAFAFFNAAQQQASCTAHGAYRLI
jgi:hypothetical protein